MCPESVPIAVSVLNDNTVNTGENGHETSIQDGNHCIFAG